MTETEKWIEIQEETEWNVLVSLRDSQSTFVGYLRPNPSLWKKIRPYRPSLLAGPLDCIQSPRRADSWLANTRASMCGDPQEKVAYKLVFTSPAVPC